MLLGPFTHETKRPAGKFSSQDLAGFDHDERLVPLVLHVEMRRAMVGVVHAERVIKRPIAKAWGIAIPRSLLLRADEVIR